MHRLHYRGESGRTDSPQNKVQARDTVAGSKKRIAQIRFDVRESRSLDIYPVADHQNRQP